MGQFNKYSAGVGVERTAEKKYLLGAAHLRSLLIEPVERH